MLYGPFGQKTMKMSYRIFRYLFLIILPVGLLLSCTTVKKIEIKPSNITLIDFCDWNLNNKQRIKEAIYNIKECNVFTQYFIDKLEKVTIKVVDDIGNFGGYVNQNKSYILYIAIPSKIYEKYYDELNISYKSTSNKEKYVNYKIQENVFKAIIHEMLHLYFINYMTSKNNRLFNERVQKICNTLRDQDLDTQYYFVNNYIAKKEKYLKDYYQQYNKNYEDGFSNLEAYTLLIDESIKRIVSTNEYVSDNQRLVLKKIDKTKEKNPLKGMPKDILEFYKECINIDLLM